ncbi:hypothetical protein M441DRAFT_48280 [Trichoderma asperellum CBS 433.97]|uniref:Azaphilone pigments biosynthesis cluster protein L N-terminal domain-containing protein n=1 Tax=Trichoderma asperellum (strain ATCC 204424 / CBS 433.97 / NBRC 101777) TaxID=1042311 RepID=A0A2T3Z6M9_TRIA4|nr:hypothetical protein M441DRAFT_48280 [Trichoderma asperellum CBS 433.97]PTB40448.1 hypothetical protein M441DRAFT_48280 [Trichoderma asperellum CBS 433.97]
MDPLSIAASVIGVVTPALHGTIRDAPNAIRLMKDDLLTIDNSLTSLQAVSEQQWKSLGDSVVAQLEPAIELYTNSCDKFRTSLGRWTRHSDDGKLSWRDQAVVGVLKQGQIKSMSEQLQGCKFLLQLSPSHLYSQLAEMNTKLGALVLAKREQNETEADRTDAISQVAAGQTALSVSRNLLEELLLGIQTAAANAQSTEPGVNIQFGDQNKGSQTGINHGTVNNTFNSRD